MAKHVKRNHVSKLPLCLLGGQHSGRMTWQRDRAKHPHLPVSGVNKADSALYLQYIQIFSLCYNYSFPSERTHTQGWDFAGVAEVQYERAEHRWFTSSLATAADKPHTEQTTACTFPGELSSLFR